MLCVEQNCKPILDELRGKEGIKTIKEMRMKIYEQREIEPCFKRCFQPFNRISKIVQEDKQATTDYITSESDVCLKTYPNNALIRARCLHNAFELTIKKLEEDER